MTSGTSVQRRDVVVMGSSAGGVTALPQILAGVSRDLPASILMVQHTAAAPRGHLVEILSRTSMVPVGWAEHGQPIRIGHAYVAPPDQHLLLEAGHIVLTGGPRENHSRPSINRLFRSAAAEYGGRTIGVILTGKLDDGVSGLTAIKTCGGVAVVQTPADAEYPEMPRNALDAVRADHVVPLREIGPLLERITRSDAPAVAAPIDVLREAALDRIDFAEPAQLDALAPQTAQMCPSCGGPLWELGDAPAHHYRCYLGHAFSARQLLASQSAQIEQSLWSAVRALQERAGTLRNLARDARRLGHELSAVDFERRAQETHDQAVQARGFLMSLQDHTAE